MGERMSWQQLLSTRRFKVKAGQVQEARASGSKDSEAGLRTDFHIDHDRVVFSSAFRRLGRKTQVHPLAVNDHTHNRLTHSVEVASVGRSLGNRVGAMLVAGGLLPEGFTPFDIGAVVQVACLAHDIGNPPFGHTGEDALRDWFRRPANAHYLAGLTEAERLDVQTYEGNAHGLRMVASLEMYLHEGGMRLTAASIGALVKYPWTAVTEPGAKKKGKFNIYQAELGYFEAVAAELGLVSKGPHCWARHPLSYLMEAADDICYAILDLEDAVEIGILGVRDFEGLLGHFVELDKVMGIANERQRCAALRGMVIGKCVDEVADCFMRQYDVIMSGEFQGKDLISVMERQLGQLLHDAKKMASDRVYRHRSKVVTEIAAYPCLATLLDILIPDAYAFCTQGEANLNTRQRTELALLDRPLEAGEGLYPAYLKILDYVGGMTDNYAATLAREVSGVGILGG
jgi:dGTPase